jgi:hypothetical protein
MTEDPKYGFRSVAAYAQVKPEFRIVLAMDSLGTNGKATYVIFRDAPNSLDVLKKDYGTVAKARKDLSATVFHELTGITWDEAQDAKRRSELLIQIEPAFLTLQDRRVR